MIMYDQDPDIFRWGLDILHVEPFSCSGYCGNTTQNDAHYYDGGYTREGNFGTDRICVENDEIIAYALQEEFSQLAVAEATGPSHTGEEQASVLTQDWFVPSMRDFYSANECIWKEADDMDSSSSCSTPGEISYEWEQLELYDESSTLDGEVGKRLNQMVSIPHVPKINGEIPSVDEATSDHQRLLDSQNATRNCPHMGMPVVFDNSAENNGELYDLVELKVQGDGNCQGLQPFASHESLEQLHRFVLILGVVHVTYCIFLVTVAVNKINSWRTWESQAEGTSFDDVKTLIINYQSTFISRGVPHAWSQNKFLLYVICFISQFLRSIDKAGYMVLRYSFIRSHELHVSYNFHNYMLRSMEDEFRDIVGISVPLWGYAIIFILLNIHGTVAYFWLSFIPLALILIIGSKLHYIVIQLALHLKNENPCKENVINPHDGLFWFGRPEYLLWLIRLNSFQNTFEMATLIWSLWEIKAPSCFIKNHVLVMIRLTLWILFQLWCSYFTFPIYVITMQMRPKLEAALVAKDIKDSINKWSKRAKYQVLRSSFAATSRASFDSMGDERDKMDFDASSITTYINSSRQFRYTSSFHNPVFSPENVASEKITGEKSSRVSNC